MLSRLWSPGSSHPRGLFFVLGMSAAVVMVLVATLMSASLGGRNQLTEDPIIASASSVIRHPLTGAIVESSVDRPAVFAVMVENSTDVRPQSGVEEAFLVYEVPVEGNITRWMALFGADRNVKEIGPVRSARPHFVEWALPWGALYAHVGGSPEALELLRGTDEIIVNLDEFFNGGRFWRSNDVLAPHNVFTESSRLVEAWEEFAGNDELAYRSRSFKDEAAVADRGVAQMITVEFGHDAYDVTWSYDPETNLYARSQEGKASVMTSGEVIEAANVAVLWTSVTTTDAEGRKRIATTGEGSARLFQDGKVIEGTWRRTAQDATLRWFDSAGKEIKWNPGQTWVEVLPIGYEVKIE